MKTDRPVSNQFPKNRTEQEEEADKELNVEDKDARDRGITSWREKKLTPETRGEKKCIQRMICRVYVFEKAVMTFVVENN